MSQHLSGPSDLTGQVAFITGGAGSMGRAIANKFVSAGAKVVAVDILDQVDIGNDIDYIKCDVRSGVDVDSVITKVLKDYKKIDILVLCAGTISRSNLTDSTDEEWQEMFDANVMGVVNPCRRLFSLMCEQGYGKILAAGSIAAKNGGVASGPAYVSAKSAVHGMVRWMAKAGAPHGVYANTLAPGPVETAMWKSVTKGKGAPDAAKVVPLGRYGNPEDIAQAALFLCSASSNWITGTSLDISGGMWMD